MTHNCELCGAPVRIYSSGEGTNSYDPLLLNDMNSYDIAKKIAREIMSTGDEPGSPAQRIEYKGGSHPDNEISQGGLCETALAEVICKAIDELHQKVEE